MGILPMTKNKNLLTFLRYALHMAATAALIILIVQWVNTDKPADTTKPVKPGNYTTPAKADTPGPVPQEKVFEITESVEIAKHQYDTLETLKKIDGLPLYYMEYTGTYDFEAFLEKGIHTPWYYGPNTRDDHLKRVLNLTAFGENKEPVLVSSADFVSYSCLVLHVKTPGVFSSISLVPLDRLGYPRGEVDVFRAIDHRLGFLEAPYWPLSGVNQHGVAAAAIIDGEAEPVKNGKVNRKIDGKVSLDGPHAIRLILDYAKTTDQAISLLKKYRIAASSYHHFFIADRSGVSAVVRYSGPEMEVTRNPRLKDSSGKISAQEAVEILKRSIVKSRPKTADDLRTNISMIYNLVSGEVSVVSGKNGKTLRFKLKED